LSNTPEVDRDLRTLITQQENLYIITWR